MCLYNPAVRILWPANLNFQKKWPTDDDIIIWLMKTMKNDKKNIWRISNLTMIYYFYILSIIINNWLTVTLIVLHSFNFCYFVIYPPPCFNIVHPIYWKINKYIHAHILGIIWPIKCKIYRSIPNYYCMFTVLGRYNPQTISLI